MRVVFLGHACHLIESHGRRVITDPWLSDPAFGRLVEHDPPLAFGIEDLDVAECLHAQLGNVANIDSADLTPELMVAPVCNTSLLGLLSGEGESEG